MAGRRAKWRDLNSLRTRGPLIYVRAFAFHEMPESRLVCEDPLFRRLEHDLRHRLFWDTLGDDSIFEPWVTVPARFAAHGWGVETAFRRTDEPGGSFKEDCPLREDADLAKLRAPVHAIDEVGTAEDVHRAQEAIGDLITIHRGRGCWYTMWAGDLSTELGHLRGIEHFMMDIHDRPAWLHTLMAFLRDGVLNAQTQAEAAGDWGLTDHQNQSMPYSHELPDPAANVRGVPRKQLWGYAAAQEFALVSPEHHEEFLLQYQWPILEPYGLVAYGCCEDLTRKIGMLRRRIPNLRRIAVSPFADVASCAEQIGGDYVVSYRPSPADMVSYSWDAQRVRRILNRDFAVLARNGCTFDITLKDVETVGRDPERVRNWVRLTRQCAAERCDTR